MCQQLCKKYKQWRTLVETWIVCYCWEICYSDLPMLQTSLSPLLWQFSSVKCKLLSGTFKNPSKHAFHLYVLLAIHSFPGGSEQKILRKERLGLHWGVPAFADVPCFIMLNHLCVGTNGFCKSQTILDYYLKNWWNVAKIIFHVTCKKNYF